MLTPIDVQNKEFKGGIGFDKKDVENFMREISSDYETIYRSNVELKDRVSTLNESLQHYRSIEDSMKKALTISEKTAEETISAASEQARQTNLEAEKKAEVILDKAKEELLDLKNEIHTLKRQYDIFKSQFTNMLEAQLKLVNGEIEEIDLGPGFESNYEPQTTNSYNGTTFSPDSPLSGGGLGGPYAGNNMDRFAQTNQSPAFDRGPLNMDPFADAMNGGGRFSRQTGRSFVSNKRNSSLSNDSINIKNKSNSTQSSNHQQNSILFDDSKNKFDDKKLNSSVQETSETQLSGEVEDKVIRSNILDSEDNYFDGFEFLNDENNTISNTSSNAYHGDIETKDSQSSMLDSKDNYMGGFEFLNDDDDDIPTILSNPTGTYSNTSNYTL